MKKILTLVLICLAGLSLHAETKDDFALRRNEIRFYMGDMFWETLIWHNDAHASYKGAGTASSVFHEKQKYAWSPHMGLEYQYRILDWLSVGLKTDFQITTWHDMSYNNQNDIVGDVKQHFYNLSILPTVRFTYYHHPHVNLFSSIGAGLDINGGSEVDIYGKNTAFGGALDVTVLGLTAGKDGWFGSIELGGLSALKDKNAFYMLCSRIITVGVGYTF